MRKGDSNDGNRSAGVSGRDVDHLGLLVPTAEDVGLDVCGWCIAGDASHILSQRLTLGSVRTGSGGLVDHSVQFHHVTSDVGDPYAQATLSG